MTGLSALRAMPFQWLLPLAFFFVGLLYLYGTPHFEASDSDEHVGVIKWIAETGMLPVQSAQHDHLHAQEASQPPLYYLLMAPVWSAMDTSDFDDFFQLNPLVYMGHPERLGNRSLAFYRQPYPPDIQGASLALYVIRLLTLGLATVSVAAMFQSARTALPGRPGFAVLATALTAFNPMFLFISVSVSNDVLVTTFASLACWLALLTLRLGFDSRRSVILGMLIGLAALSKLSGLALAPVVALAGAWLLWRTGDRRGFVILIGAITLATLLLTGWWFLRNLALYGELFGTATMLENFGGRNIPLAQLLLEEFEGLRISYWGLFGSFSIFTHRIHYLLMDALSLLGFLGLLVFLAQHRRNRLMLSIVGFLASYLALGGVTLIWWALQTTGSTGRLLFPYSIAIGILLALGIRALRVPAALIFLPMFAFSIATPFAYIMPQYDHPPPVKRLPDSAVETIIHWDDITLVGYEAPAEARWSPGDDIPLTLYWEPLKATDELQALFISLIDADGAALATIDSFPGWGTLPTTWWQRAVIYKDDYILQIPTDAQGISNVQLHIGWYPFPGGANIQPALGSGEPAGAFTIPIGAFVNPDSQQTLEAGAIKDGAVFGEAIRLDAWRFSDGHILELAWRLTREIAGDLRVFAIVLKDRYQPDQPFEIVAQADKTPPARLDFLKPGETFVTRHRFEPPPGSPAEYSVYIGWYDESLSQRLGAPYPQNMLELPALPFSAPE